MKKLRIAQIAPLWFTIPPKGYGGIERVVASLTNDLISRGHKVTVFAAPGSKTAGRLESVYPKPLIEAGVSWNNPLWHLQNLAYAYEKAKNGEFDIIHSHLDVWTLFFQDLVKTPTVITMHNALHRIKTELIEDDRLSLFYRHRKNSNIAFVSKSLKKNAMVKFPNAKVIYNGIDISNFDFNPHSGNHFIWVARIDKYKGIENAITAAEKSGAKLLLAGRLDPVQKPYFNSRIKPRLNKNIKYTGELKGEELEKFYGSAKALLYPIEWEEPFGLVVAESMACGTPVIAYCRGSMPELIKNGQTGFLVNNISEMLKAMKKIDTIDRLKVRKRIESNFCKEQMTDNYEKLYYEILNR